MIQIAHELGYKTVNVVRRAELIDELRAEGGDIVLVDGDNLREEVKSATGGASVRLGLNSVAAIARCAWQIVSPGGTLVSFGAMSLQPLKIPTGLLIFKDLRFRGIWINKWCDNATPAERMERFDRFRYGQAWSAQNENRKSLSTKRSQSRSRTCGQGKRSGKIV